MTQVSFTAELRVVNSTSDTGMHRVSNRDDPYGAGWDFVLTHGSYARVRACFVRAVHGVFVRKSHETG